MAAVLISDDEWDSYVSPRKIASAAGREMICCHSEQNDIES